MIRSLSRPKLRPDQARLDGFPEPNLVSDQDAVGRRLQQLEDGFELIRVKGRVGGVHGIKHLKQTPVQFLVQKRYPQRIRPLQDTSAQIGNSVGIDGDGLQVFQRHQGSTPVDESNPHLRASAVLGRFTHDSALAFRSADDADLGVFLKLGCDGDWS